MTDVTTRLERYPDGRWWPTDHTISERFPLLCRGNTGEVFPNVVYPLTGSIFNEAAGRGMVGVLVEMGFLTREQAREFDETAAMTANIAGYLYGNVSVARSGVARTPGLTIEMVDRQLFGLSDAPPHVPSRGERSLVASAKSVTALGRGILRPSDRLLRAARDQAATFLASASDTSAPTPELLDLPDRAVPLFERLMHDLIAVSSLAGASRGMLERLVGPLGDDDLVNRLTSGLGTIESAEPAVALWALGRLVAASPELGAAFDAGPDDVLGAIATSSTPAGHRFRAEFAAFRDRHGARGPDEWELHSPTWGTDPAIALRAIDRLRHAPDGRDPAAVGETLARERRELGASTRAALPRGRRRAFDLAMRSIAHYSAQREATKALFVRVLFPVRLALAEVARRSGLSHDDAFLLTLDELRCAVDDPEPFRETIDERAARRAFLQARIPPFWFQGEIPDPSTWPLRADARRTLDGERRLSGIGVCSGVATGTARVVMDPAEPGEMAPGDILVAPITDPAWTPLFLAAAGVVVDVGAHLSHAAIVSRELGIPAVVSATGASATIPDGALVTVDGSAGIVTVHG